MKLIIEDMSFSYGKNRVLQHVNMEVEEGNVIAIIGKNGSGKTTLLKLIGDFLKPTAGKITISDNERVWQELFARNASKTNASDFICIT